MFWLQACLCLMCAPVTHRGHKKVSDHLGLEFRANMKMLGIDPWSSRKVSQCF